MALLTTEGVSGTSVNVDTVNGLITLHGKVNSEAEKAKAESAVRGIEGAKNVRNLLQVVSEKRENASGSDERPAARAGRAKTQAFPMSERSVGEQGRRPARGQRGTLGNHLRAVSKSVPRAA